MRKGLTWAAVAVLLVASGLVWVSQSGLWEANAKGSDVQRTIPLSVYSIRDDLDGTRKVGDACEWFLPIVNVVYAPPQIVVRDQADRIIAMKSIEGGTIEATQRENHILCSLQLEIAVPDAEFYTVYLGTLSEIRIVGYSASDFPLGTERPIWIDPDFDYPDGRPHPLIRND